MRFRTSFGANRFRKRSPHHAKVERSSRVLFGGECLEARALLAVDFHFNAAPGTPPQVINGFKEAGDIWASFLSDDVRVEINIGLQPVDPMQPGVLGETTNNRLSIPYSQLRAALLADTTSTDDVTAAANIPNAPALSVFMNLTADNPNGSGSLVPYVDADGGPNNTTMSVPRANAKALGIPVPNDGVADGSIVFRDATPPVRFDFDRTDGIGTGLIDFVFVAFHEIGHLLGFESGVDFVDRIAPGTSNDDAFVNITPLDLFRSSPNSRTSGANLDLTADPRQKLFSIDGGVTSLGSFSPGVNNGGCLMPDRCQASHWADATPPIGVMDPTAALGTVGAVTSLDLIAFDVIGWDLDLDDRFEANNTLGSATPLGSEPTIILQDLRIAAGTNEDHDVFRYVAHSTGLLSVSALFDHDLGDIDVQIRDATGDLIAGGTSVTDNEHVVIPVVGQRVYFIDVFGFPSFAVNEYALEIENFPVPNPTSVILSPASDTGVFNNDNVTTEQRPSFFVQADIGEFLLAFVDMDGDGRVENDEDSNGNGMLDAGEDVDGDGQLDGDEIGVMGDLLAAITVEVQLTNTLNPAVPPVVGSAIPLAAFLPTLFSFTPATSLPAGVYVASAAVRIRDRATPVATGRSQFSPTLLVTIEADSPPASFGQPGGTDGLHSASNTGVAVLPATFGDRVTANSTPRFFGLAEAQSTVRLFADLNTNGIFDATIDPLLGQTTAVPYGQNPQFANGYWEIEPTIDLNSVFGTRDGLRRVLITAEDYVGNINFPGDGSADDPDQVLDIFLDTQGPQIARVDINSRNNAFNLFDSKPSGPTPLVNSLVISVADSPDRGANASFQYDALVKATAEDVGQYVLKGDHNGTIAIQSIVFTPDARQAGAAATGFITLTFENPLPDDRYTLMVKDGLRDDAGNQLDGESNGTQPLAAPVFPSGNGIAGGTFEVRFTVDSRPEVGVWSAGSVHIDTNGNFLFDPQNADATNRDISHTFGFTSDELFAGNFVKVAGATADRFDKLAAYGRVNGSYRWIVDVDNDGTIDTDDVNQIDLPINGFPVAGNWDGNAANGDEVALFTGTVWWFDTNHDFVVDTSRNSGVASGYPIAGDFDGDGTEDCGSWTNDSFQFDLRCDGSREATLSFGFPGTSERPVAADMDGDGITDVGLWVPNRSGASPSDIGEWYFLVSDGEPISERTKPFTPVPFDKDLYAQFGSDFALPIVGNFDPPVAAGTSESLIDVVGLQVAGSSWSSAVRSKVNSTSDKGFSVNLSAGTPTPLSWSNLNQLTVRFAENATVAQNDLSLRDSQGNSYPISGFQYDSVTHSGTWTLGRSLSPGVVTVNFTNASVGNLPPTSIRVSPGDVTGDGVVNHADLAGIVSRYGATTASSSYSAAHDINGDGKINLADLLIQRSLFVSPSSNSSPAAQSVIASNPSTSENGTGRFGQTVDVALADDYGDRRASQRRNLTQRRRIAAITSGEALAADGHTRLRRFTRQELSAIAASRVIN